MRSLVAAIIALLIPILVPAQTKPITLDAQVVWAGVDRAGDLFVVVATGEVKKFDKNGKTIGSHRFTSPPTLLDPIDGVRSFYYQRNGNRYGFMSYDFSTVDDKELDPSFAINPWLVCPALHELWILDSADFTIKKTRMNSMAISLESTLKHLPEKKMEDYVALREYQNYLFLLDRSAGVHVFNPLGRYVRTLGEKDMTYFSFLGEELYYIKDKEVVFIDLYTQERRTLAQDQAYQFVLLNDDTRYGVLGKEIHIAPFKP
ncbi:MAG: hypothetical protein JNN04_11600 [Cyclobacteriaceae bacterium]|nr:hypothetical protein [Cyclobacteriaceae bacterium]